MARRGGRRPRRIVPGEVAAWVSSGRWGPKRARVEQCVAILTAEQVYDRLLRDGEPLSPGWIGGVGWTPNATKDRQWEIEAEVRPNAVWRAGRLFLRCPRCSRRATRVYIPAVTADPRCRRCWGLNYSSQSWSYKPTGVFGRLLGPLAYATTFERRTQRKAASVARWQCRAASRQ